MNWQTEIPIDTDVLVGKPFIKGTRLSVELIIDLLAQGWSKVQACLAYVNEILRAERAHPPNV